MILLIDNYDSFSYNLVHLAGLFDSQIRVVRNDQITIDGIKDMNPSHIILSPGPGHPKDAGICEEVVKKLSGVFPILGVCLGHQAICEAFGGEICHARKLMHGKKSTIIVDTENPIFRGLPKILEGARYHSLALKRDSLPDRLKIIAEDESGEIMAVGHRDYSVYGLKFHPESILTPMGNVIMKNFLSIGKEVKS